MDLSSGGEGLALLQLHKWGPSWPQLNLSDYRDAFISPTRQLLLLFSNQCEALLLPLLAGDSIASDEVKNNYDTSGSSAFSSQAPTLHSDAYSRGDDMPCTSGSLVVGDLSSESEISRSISYPFVSDVSSLAWGVCEDTYDKHEDTVFRELLFVSGSHGVTVHAFCKSNIDPATTNTVLEGEFGQGRWVEWGPCAAQAQNAKNISVANGNSESPHDACEVVANDDSSSSITSRRWLQSFLIEVEDFEHQGKIWTRFPVKSSFPSSANVVSFNIFNTHFPFMDFPPCDDSLANKDNLQEAFQCSEVDVRAELDFVPSGAKFRPNNWRNATCVGMNSSYKCSRVFSSNSYCLIGFFLNLVDHISVEMNNESDRNLCKNVLLVARLHTWGIQWTSSINLDKTLSIGPLAEWRDFCFSENLLVCLDSSGMVVLYASVSGEYVGHMDIIQTCGLRSQPDIQQQDKFSADDAKKSSQADGIHDRTSYERDNHFGKRIFKRLIAASHTSLVGVIDEYGMVYVICISDSLTRKCHTYEKLLPSFWYLGFGLSVGWEVGGSDIGFQRIYTNSSGSHDHNTSGTRKDCYSSMEETGKYALHQIQECNHNKNGLQCTSYSSVFSAALEGNNYAFHDAKTKLQLMRKFFLPTHKLNEDDSICLTPFGITRLIRRHRMKGQKGSQLVHLNLHAEQAVCDDSYLYKNNGQRKDEAITGDVIGFSFLGYFYLVTEGGLSVVLPSISISSNFLPIDSIGYRQSKIASGIGYQFKGDLEMNVSRQPWLPWKIEVLDRVLLYESMTEAERLCSENGWDPNIVRIRWLQLALEYMKFDEIERSLEMLVAVNLAEEGILRLLFAAVYMMVHKVGNDIDVSTASRLLMIATCFAIKMIRKYGLMIQHDKHADISASSDKIGLLPLPPISPAKLQNEVDSLSRMQEMAQFLETIRNLQSRLSSKFKRLDKGLVDGGQASAAFNASLSLDGSEPSILQADTASLESPEHNAVSLSVPAAGSDFMENLALSVTDSKSNELGDTSGVSSLVPGGGSLQKKILLLENPKEMIARWKLDNMDLKTVVSDALLSGRLPLAVLQLHLYHSKDSVSDREHLDTFTEVREIGKAIAYELFLKGETGLAVATLQRLGEDVESSLKQLLFGTVRRNLRAQIMDEINRYGYLGPFEWKILDRISLLERLYPSSSFWKTFTQRQKECMRVAASSGSNRRNFLRLLHSHVFNDFIIECGEIDGAVLGSWTTVNENPSASEVVDEDETQAAYWAAAAVWASHWDQRTIDRIVLDQSSFMDVHISWESQLEYHVCHNDWEKVSKLLDLIPDHVLVDGSLQINLDSLQPACDAESSKSGNYMCYLEELDTVCMDVPNVKVLMFPVNMMGSLWLKMLMEEKLAKKLIFLKEYWENTIEIIPLLARSGFITSTIQIFPKDEFIESFSADLSLIDGETLKIDTIPALHKLLIRHCVKFNLPFLLDFYLDQHKLALDFNSLCSLQDATGDCEWAKWLLLSRIKGCEYDASFSNARSVMSRNLSSTSKITDLEMDEIICTVDDIAECGGELAGIATLMYAPLPIQSCLTSGSVKKHGSSSAQCTLENLEPTLQHFPTLRRTLMSAGFGQDKTFTFLGSRANNVLADYLNWRDNIFFSAGRDTSLLQMLPCWFPKAVRRLIQLYIQGPLGLQSVSGMPIGEIFLHRASDFFINENVDENAETNAISWESTVQKHIEEELYDPALQESIGFEHHLRRGRALAAFNQFLVVRVQKLKSEVQSSALVHGQTNVQSDVQMLLASLTESEQSLLLSVMPLAIIHFEDHVLVASCAFLLELCGLSASMLRVDVAALRRITSYYKSTGSNENLRQLPQEAMFHPVSHEGDVTGILARALADEYLHQDGSSIAKKKEPWSSITGGKSSPALTRIMHYLEKASLPLMVYGKTCGFWLSTGNGDGIELRSQQKAASQHWNLVNIFCQMHRLPLSTKYLSLLARDNDWVGFLSEAQVGGYPFDTVMQVASKEFSDPRLRIHILSVLRSMQSRRKASSLHSDIIEKRTESSFPDEDICIPVELFRILADCEKQKNPGEALLMRAKDLSWSILAMIASCFSDVSPLSCLRVWLEITAARETSSIKVNDIASQIADNVNAAVEATNSLLTGSRAVTFHYNRKSSKRRRFMEPLSIDPLVTTSSDASYSSVGTHVFVAQDTMVEEERKVHLDKEKNISNDSDAFSLSKMVAVLCEQQLFLPLLRAFEMFLPSCSLLPFIRALQAFSQMRLDEVSAHLGSFSARIKEEPAHLQANIGREGHISRSWISSTAIEAADAMLLTCPSPYEKRCLLQLLAATDFGDGGSAATCYRRLYWKINLAEPLLRKDTILHLGNETLDDSSLLTALEKNGYWEQACNWAKQLEGSGGIWKSSIHHVTETQAESMVAEWKEFLWDVPEERVALWSHCNMLFVRYSFPALQAGLFFLKHAEAVEKDLPARELHELLLLSLQWLSGMIALSIPVYPLHLLREIETKVWLLAVEAEEQVKNEGEFNLTTSSRDPMTKSTSSIIDQTASVITKMDSHINTIRSRAVEKHDAKENKTQYDVTLSTMAGGSAKIKRRTKGCPTLRRPLVDPVEKISDPDEASGSVSCKSDMQLQEEGLRTEMSFSRWEERVRPAEVERAVLSLLEFGQVAAAKQLQHKLSPGYVPSEFVLVDAALKVAAISTPSSLVSLSMLDEDVRSVLQSHNLLTDQIQVEPLEVLENLASILTEGCGRGLCKRIIAVVKAANILGLAFPEAFDKQTIELLQLLSLKAQESFEEAYLLVQTHTVPAASIAQILAESFLKGLLAAHRGGYMDSQKEEGPAPLLWRFSDFLKWAELCSSESEIGHALMRIVITGQEIPHACEVELLILSHHFYKSSACLDGVDVLVALAATRVEAYVSEGDFPCLARLITGVGNFHTLNFILGILIENGQLDLLLQKYSAAADTNTSTAEAVRGFRMAVLTSLKHFNPNDLDAFAMVYNHFDMKHETAAILESRAEQSSEQWFHRYDKDQNEDLLDSMRYYIEAAEVHSSIDAGNKTRRACAQASLVSLQIRMPDFQWLYRSETNARRALVEQSRFQEALIVAEAYGLNQPSEWALVLWNQMLKPEVLEEFVAEFVAVLPLQPSMLVDLAKFYRAEMAARGDQSQFSVWLTGGGLPAEWAKYLGRSFRCLLKRTRDLRLRLQLATLATGFGDVIDACMKASDRVPENTGPLVLRKGHGGAYLPLM